MLGTRLSVRLQGSGRRDPRRTYDPSPGVSSLLVLSLLVSLPVAVLEHSNQNNLERKRKGAIFRTVLCATSWGSQGSKSLKQPVTSHPQPGNRESRMCAGVPFPSMQSGRPCPQLDGFPRIS